MFARPVSIQVSGVSNLRGLHGLNGYAVSSTKNPSVGCQLDGTCLQAMLARIPSAGGRALLITAAQPNYTPLINTLYQTGAISQELFNQLSNALNIVADSQPSELRAAAASTVASEIIPALQGLMTGAPDSMTPSLPTVATTMDTVSNLWDKLTGKTPVTLAAQPTGGTTVTPVTPPGGSLTNTLANSAMTKTSNIVLALGAVAVLGGLLVYLRKRKGQSMGSALAGYLGHPGMLTRAGCHRNHRTGKVHCHQPRGYQTGGGRRKGRKSSRKARR